MSRHGWARLGAYLLVVAMFAFSLWRIEQVYQHDKAQACVAAWERVEGIRDMGEATYRRNARTLIALSTNADPDKVAAYKAQVERDVLEIRAKVADPICDLTTAKRRLR